MSLVKQAIARAQSQTGLKGVQALKAVGLTTPGTRITPSVVASIGKANTPSTTVSKANTPSTPAPSTPSTTVSKANTPSTRAPSTSQSSLMDKAKELEEWFRRNLIPVLFIALGMIMIAVFAGTKAGRQAVREAFGAPIKR